MIKFLGILNIGVFIYIGPILKFLIALLVFLKILKKKKTENFFTRFQDLKNCI